MLGGRFDEHPWGITDGTVVVDDPKFPAMRHLPPRVVVRDELYQIKDFSRDKIHVLAHLDASRLDLTQPLVHRKDGDFPAAWSKTLRQGPRLLFDPRTRRRRLGQPAAAADVLPGDPVVARPDGVTMRRVGTVGWNDRSAARRCLEPARRPAAAARRPAGGARRARRRPWRRGAAEESGAGLGRYAQRHRAARLRVACARGDRAPRLRVGDVRHLHPHRFERHLEASENNRRQAGVRRAEPRQRRRDFLSRPPRDPARGGAEGRSARVREGGWQRLRRRPHGDDGVSVDGRSSASSSARATTGTPGTRSTAP